MIHFLVEKASGEASNMNNKYIICELVITCLSSIIYLLIDFSTPMRGFQGHCPMSLQGRIYFYDIAA
jgi:hypothetical protein